MGLSQLTFEAIRMRLAGDAGLTTASGSAATTTGSIIAGSNTLTVASASSFSVGQGIKVAGAGTGGSSLLTWITAKDSNTLTLYDKAVTAVTDAVVSHDDRAVVEAGNILPHSVNFPAEFPAILLTFEGSTAFNFPGSISGYFWIAIYFNSDDSKGQPLTVINMITDRVFALLHNHENDMSNDSIRIDICKEMFRSGIMPESEIGEYVHSQTVRYEFMSHGL